MASVFGPPLAAALAELNATELVEQDPKAAVASGAGGPLTCGGSTWLGDTTAFVFAVGEGVPVAIYLDQAAPDRECLLVVAEGGAPPA